MTDVQMMDFIRRKEKSGYVWQYLTLASFHADTLIVFAKDFATKGKLAYVEKIQKEKTKHGVDTFAHQKWSGSKYNDRVIQQLTTVQGGISDSLQQLL